MKYRWIINTLLSVGLIFSFSACNNSAENEESVSSIQSTESEEEFSTIPSRGLKYTLSNDGTYYVVTEKGTCMDVDIVIDSTYNGLPVTKIENGAFKDCDLTSVVIPDSVTTIGICAFAECSDLRRVKIGNGVISIGEEAFTFCSSLKKISLPDSVTTIGDYSFANCERLESVTIGKGMDLIGYRAFDGCISLNDITYNGTKEEWTIIKKSRWNAEVPAKTVVCIDGDLEIVGDS